MNKQNYYKYLKRESKINLVLQEGKNFLVGDKISFEVDFENSECLPITNMDIKLMQKMIYVTGVRDKQRDVYWNSRDFIPGLQFNSMSTKVAHLDCPCYSSNTWTDVLKVPWDIPPTKDSFELNKTLAEQNYIMEIQYALKVHLNEMSEMCEVLSEEFPIRIGLREVGVGVEVLSNVLSTGNGQERARSRARARGHSSAGHPTLSELAVRESHRQFRSLQYDDLPPRYSNLPSPILGYNNRSNSVETLPPCYEDVINKYEKR